MDGLRGMGLVVGLKLLGWVDWKNWIILLVLFRKCRIRKNVFIKDNISRGEKILFLKIIYSIAFLSKRIPKKDARMCTFVEFVFGVEVGGIA